MAELLYYGCSKGIYVSNFDPEAGTLTKPVLAAELPGAGFLALHPKGGFIYANTEVTGKLIGRFNGLAALKIDAATGMLKLIDRQKDSGSGICHVSVDIAGKFALAADYGSGDYSVMKIEADGSLGKITAAMKSVGHSIDKSRQEGPHAHQISFDLAGKFVFVCDLGTDKVLIHKFDPDTGTLTPAIPPDVDVPPGSGPRHIAFHPSGKFAYVLTEMKSTVVAFNYYPEHGNLRQMQVISALPADFAGKSSASEIEVHPNGRFLYTSNRGLDSIARFSIDEFTGKLSNLVQTPTQGKWPRHFTIHPTGKFLLVANQNSGNVVVFKIDPQTGDLSATGVSANVPDPMCLVIAPVVG